MCDAVMHTVNWLDNKLFIFYNNCDVIVNILEDYQL